MSHFDEDEVSVSPSEPFPSAQQQSISRQQEFGILDTQSDLHSDPLEDDDLDSFTLENLEAVASSDKIPEQEIFTQHDKIPEAASDDDFLASPAPSSRPNRCHGSSSTWRNQHAPEIEIAVSLDKFRADDLSSHLYNAYRLKRKDTLSAIWQVKIVDGLADSSAGADWVLPKIWTAWPMSPETVPRELEAKQWSEEAQCPRPYIAKPSRPGQALQDLLIAQVLRKAKDKFVVRVRDSCFPLNPIDSQHSPPSSKKHTAGSNVNLKPMIMTDDERATDILRPTIQHIMTSLDDLLMGLHHARSSYLVLRSSETDIQSREIQRPLSMRGARKRDRSQASSAASKKTGSRFSSDTDPEDVIFAFTNATAKDESKRPGSRSKDRIAFAQRKNQLGLRDWSDVFGVASITGLDPIIVGKASARCAALFDQGIKFRTLHEGAPTSAETSFLPHTVDSGDLDHAGSDAKGRDMMFGGVHVDGFLQPIEGKKSWKYPNRSQQNSSSRRSRSRAYSRHQKKDFN